MDYKKQIIKDLIEKRVDFTVYTDIAYGRGLNGIDYNSYSTHGEFGDSLKTLVTRTFELYDDYLVIIEDYVPPEIHWNKKAEKKPYTRRNYIGYDRITYIKELVED